jgi:hypothetical protein
MLPRRTLVRPHRRPFRGIARPRIPECQYQWRQATTGAEGWRLGRGSGGPGFSAREFPAAASASAPRSSTEPSIRANTIGISQEPPPRPTAGLVAPLPSPTRPVRM